LDDADAAHAQAAQHIVESGDFVTSRINGIRYIEKPPLPYWLVAIVYAVAGQNAFATHLPNALAMLGLAWLSWLWARAPGMTALVCMPDWECLHPWGPFLFTRFIIPEAILSLFLLISLYCLLTGLEWNQPNRLYGTWSTLALAILTKGLIGPVFFFGGAIPYLWLTGQWRRWRALKPFSGLLLFLAIARPGTSWPASPIPTRAIPLAITPPSATCTVLGGSISSNEHFLRFFGQRYPHDYNKLPFAAYWVLHLAWLFPWSLFLPALFAVAWKTRYQWRGRVREDADADIHIDSAERHIRPTGGEDAARNIVQSRFRARSVLLLTLFTAFTLLFFSISTNQEYYTFPAWPPLFILIAGVLAGIEENRRLNNGQPLLSTAWLTGAQAVFGVVGVLAAIVLGWGLWDSRNLPFVADIGTLLAHRDVAGYTLAMSHLFDLTGPSFAALRLPAVMAAVTLLVGRPWGWLLRLKGRHLAATISVALTSAVFLVAAHIALARFEPMLSSKQLADTIIRKGSPADSFIIMGEQSDASSVIFYTHSFLRKPALLVYPRCGQHGEGTTLLWGSCYPDAPEIFLSEDQLSASWGTGERKWLFAEDTNRTRADDYWPTVSTPSNPWPTRLSGPIGRWSESARDAPPLTRSRNARIA